MQTRSSKLYGPRILQRDESQQHGHRTSQWPEQHNKKQPPIMKQVIEHSR